MQDDSARKTQRPGGDSGIDRRTADAIARAVVEMLEPRIRELLVGCESRPHRDIPDLLRLKDVPDFLGVSRSTVRRLIEGGELDRVQDGVASYVTGDSISRFRGRLQPGALRRAKQAADATMRGRE